MVLMYNFFVQFIYFIVFLNIVSTDFPLTHINDGLIKGKFWKIKENRTISAFTGIPYAKPPVGNLRFMPPVPPDPWKSIFDATKNHTECVQRDVFTRKTAIFGDEDCLYLNVYTPKVDSFERNLLPVMVYIHGGGFLAGSGNPQSHGPDILLDKDIVLVVMNYRLGPLGFISTGDNIIPGNNGLKDQNLALKWVRNNIKGFGGNANRTTLMGYSAGGTSVHYHMLSPLSQGLFERAIIASGNALCPWAFGENNETVKNTEKLAESLNCSTKSSISMIECLRKIDAKVIIGQDKIFMRWDIDPIMPFKPTIESDVPGAFLTNHPRNLMKSGKCMDIPVIIGITSDEGAFKAAELQKFDLLDEYSENFDEIAPYSIFYEERTNDTKAITRAIREFYFKDRKIKDSAEDIIKLYTDSWMLMGTDEFITLFTKYYTQPVYYFLFAYRGSISLTPSFQGGSKIYGVCHGDPLIYLFPIGKSIQPDWIPTKTDRNIMNTYSSLLTNFVIYGNPTPTINEYISINWNTCTRGHYEYLEISDHLEMKSKMYENRTEFWRNIFKY